MRRKETWWLDRKENVTRVYLTLWAIALISLLPGFFLHKHEELGFAASFSFYALFGFAACVALVLTAKALRRVLMRPEDYYDR